MPIMSTVPMDMWICGICKGTNLIALTNGKCPVCGHEKDTCCTGPGEAYPEPNTNSSTLLGSDFWSYLDPCPAIPNPLLPFSTRYEFHPHTSKHHFDAVDMLSNSFQYCTPSNCLRIPQLGANDYECSEQNSLSEHNSASTPSNYFITPQDIITCPGAGTPAPGAWTCDNCGAGNGDATLDWCPACGASRQ